MASVCEARGLGVVMMGTFMSCGVGASALDQARAARASETHRPCATGDSGDSGPGHRGLGGRCLSRHRPVFVACIVGGAYSVCAVANECPCSVSAQDGGSDTMLVQGQGPRSDMGGLPGETPVGSPEPCTRGLEPQEHCWSVPKQVCPRGWGVCAERWHALHTTLESLHRVLPQLSTGRGARQCSGLRDTVWLPHTQHFWSTSTASAGFSAWPQVFRGPNGTS